MAYTKEEARRLVIEGGKRLLQSGLVVRTWGNISARISEEQFVITPSGKAYESLTPEDIVVVNISDLSYEGEVKPSSERGVHAQAYRLRKDVNFVIHTHQSNASALSILGKNMEHIGGYMEGADGILGSVIPCAQYGRNASKKIQNNVAIVIEDYPESKAFFMKNHGALCLGKDCEQAFRVADTLERISGFRFREMCKDALEEKEKLGSDEYRSAFLKIFEEAFDPDYEKRKKLYDLPAVEAICYSHAPYTKLMANQGEILYPFIDDLAQIGGEKILWLKRQSTYGEIASALKKNSAVLIEEVGAVCVGANASEAEAVALVLEKAAKASVLAKSVGNVAPLSYLDAHHDRKTYIKSYSKLK